MDNYELTEQHALEKYYEMLRAQPGYEGIMIPIDENGKITSGIESSIFNLAEQQYHNFTGFVLGVENGKLSEDSIAAIEELIPEILGDLTKNREELYNSYMSKAKFDRNEKDFFLYEFMLNRISNQYNLYTQACNEFGIDPKEMYTFKSPNSKSR